MAIIQPTITQLTVSSLKAGSSGHAVKVVWANVKSGDTCAPVDLFANSDRSVQVTGPFSGATLRVEGSNDDSTYHTLKDVFGTALTYTSADLRTINELTAKIKPAIADGDGNTSVTVTMFARG